MRAFFLLLIRTDPGRFDTAKRKYLSFLLSADPATGFIHASAFPAAQAKTAKVFIDMKAIITSIALPISIEGGAGAPHVAGALGLKRRD